MRLHFSQFSSVQVSPLTDWVVGEGWGDMRDDSAEIPFQSFLQEALVSRSGISRDVHSLMLSIEHFLCRLRCRPPFKVPWVMVLERLSWYMTFPKHASFRLLTVARRGSCGLTRKLILLRTQSFSQSSNSERYVRLPLLFSQLLLSLLLPVPSP